MKRVLLFLILMLGIGQTAGAARFAGVFGDRMVLQQQSSVRLWGYGDAGRRIRIDVSWSKERYTAKVGENGRWELTIPTPEASFTARSITLTDHKRQKQQLNEVLIGEVWLCSGQSNMEMIMRPDSTWKLFVENAEAEIAAADHPAIRYINVARKESFTPAEDLEGHDWKVCTPESVRWLSAAGYYFACRLQRELGVPVGLIVDSYGGSPLQSWLPEEYFERPFYAPERERLARHRESGAEKPEYDMASSLYNGMLHPVIGYTIRGFLWYQGCSNVSDAARYPVMMEDLVSAWRKAWNDEQLPFYFVQIAPFIYPHYQLGRWAELAYAQQLAARQITRSGLVVTADIGDPQNIHPGKKRPVGERLAGLALQETYGLPVGSRSPEVTGAVLRDGKVLLDLCHAGSELHAEGSETEFEVSQDGVLYSRAAFTIKGNRIELTAPFGDIRYVRYCWRDNARSNIFNADRLPLGPFTLKIDESK